MATPNLPRKHVTLRDLVRETGQHLARMRLLHDDRRTRATPDARTVRYYMAQGIVDGPQARRGVVGLYGRRHLLQLLAIKTLQAEGVRLRAIASRLRGLDDHELLALLPRLSPPGLDDESGPQLPAGTHVRLEVAVQPGLVVHVDPRLLRDPAHSVLLGEAVGAALDRAGRAYSQFQGNNA